MDDAHKLFQARFAEWRGRGIIMARQYNTLKFFVPPGRGMHISPDNFSARHLLHHMATSSLTEAEKGRGKRRDFFSLMVALWKVIDALQRNGGVGFVHYRYEPELHANGSMHLTFKRAAGEEIAGRAQETPEGKRQTIVLRRRDFVSTPD